MQAGLLHASCAELGEGPAWDARQQALYWVDILAKRVYRGAELLLQLDDFVGCLAPRRQGGLVLALRNRLVEWDSGSGGIRKLAEVDEPPGNRFNDGKCDPAGRFLAGTMDQMEKEATGSLYSYDGRQVRKLLGGIGISNGLAWSPDYRRLYYIDTPRREIQAFDYDLSQGGIANGRSVIRVPQALGWPDGMTSDMNGDLWVAMWGGAQVTHWDPAAGILIDCIPVPALQPSSCVFGGAGLNELYITSARKGLNPGQLRQYPLSGSLFRVSTKVTGMPTFEFASGRS